MAVGSALGLGHLPRKKVKESGEWSGLASRTDVQILLPPPKGICFSSKTKLPEASVNELPPPKGGGLRCRQAVISPGMEDEIILIAGGHVWKIYNVTEKGTKRHVGG